MRFLLVDGHSHLYRAYHAIAHLSTSRGIPTNATYGMTAMLWKLLREESPDYMAVIFDAPGPTFRHEAFEAYKIQRPGMPDDLVVQIPWIKALIQALRTPILEMAGFEGDDVMAALTVRARENVDVVLVTGDKDMLQLVGPHVRVLSVAGRAGEKTIYDEAAVEEKWGVPPARIPDLLGLMGDSIDNIPGVPGIGEVTAVKLLRQFGSLETIFEKLDQVAGAKLQRKLTQYREQALLSRRLATVAAETPVEFRLENFRVLEPDWPRLRELLTELEFTTLLRQLPQPAISVESQVTILPPGPEQAGFLSRAARARTLALEWVGEGALPDLRASGLALVGPEVGAAYLPLADGIPPALRGLVVEGPCLLVGHDLKPAIAWFIANGVPLVPARLFDTAVAAYLLNSGRTNFRLEEIALEHGLMVTELPKGLLALSPSAVAPAAVGRAQVAWDLRGPLESALERDGLAALFRDLEMPLIPILARMELDGIRVDPGRLESMAKEVERLLDSLTIEIHHLAGEPFNINSPKQLAQVLFERLKLPVVKRTKTGPSTDVEVLQELALAHPLAEKILEYRQLAKLKSTYIDALPGLVHSRTGRIHTSYNQMVTATGRLSSSNPNLQNIPVRTELGRRIRQAFVPEPGWSFLACDYSQIELRVLAHMAGEEVLIEAFQRDEDIHARTAAELFHVDPADVTPEMRRVAKATNFGVIYGISAFGLAQGLKIPQQEAQRYIGDYFARHPKVRAYIDRTLEEGRQRGYVVTLLGRRRYLPELTSPNPNTRGMAERMAMNAPIQGSSADLIKLAMIRVSKAMVAAGHRSRMLLQVHDELLFEVPPEEREQMRELARETMESVMALAVPLKVEIKEGGDWAEV